MFLGLFVYFIVNSVLPNYCARSLTYFLAFVAQTNYKQTADWIGQSEMQCEQFTSRECGSGQGGTVLPARTASLYPPIPCTMHQVPSTLLLTNAHIENFCQLAPPSRLVSVLTTSQFHSYIAVSSLFIPILCSQLCIPPKNV